MEVRISNATRMDGKVASIKAGTFHYSASAASNVVASFNGVFSSYIEFEFYVGNGFAVSNGDCLTVFQVVDVDKSFNDTYPTTRQIYMFPSFYVKSIKQNSNTTYVIAYDCAANLDVDYSQRLKSLENSFPMTLEDLYNDILSFTGLLTSDTLPTMNPSIAAITVKKFYANGITARELVNQIIALFGTCLRGSSLNYLSKTNYSITGNVIAWLPVSEYVICPGDGTYYQADGVTPAVNVWYKQHGLSLNGIVQKFDGVEIIASDGSVAGAYYGSSPATNIFKISNNLIFENIDTYPIYVGANYIAQFIYNGLALSALPYMAARVSIFPFRNPFMIGTTARLVDVDGNYYNVPIMSIDMTSESVTIESFALMENEDQTSVSNPVSMDVRVTELESYIKNIWDYIYPIGSIYISVDPTDPADLFGGTWEQIKDTFLLTAGDIYDAGDTGGEATHTLTITEMPSHTHDTFYNNNVSASGSNRRNPAGQTGNSTLSPGTSATGGGQAHNNMPPYLVVYAWQRVADEADYLVTIDGDYLTTVDGDYLTL